MIEKNIQVIIVSKNRNAIDVDKKIYLAAMNNALEPGFSESEQLLWYMGALAHEAYHGWQYRNGDTTPWKELSMSERVAKEIGPLDFQIGVIFQCSDNVPGSTHSEVEFLTKQLKDYRGVVPCTYCE